MEQSLDISVSNINNTATKEGLNQIFSEIGPVDDIIFDSFTHKAKITYKNLKHSLESIQKINHQKIFSDDIHVSFYRSAELKLKMRRWKILARKIIETTSYSDLYSFFEQFGQVHHISYYPEKKIACIQYFTKESAENCMQNQPPNFVLLYAWPQFSPGPGHQYIEIQGLPYDFDENKLENLVKSYGKITSMSMLFYLPHLNKKTTVAFASFESKSQQKAAIDALDSKKIDRKMIFVWRLFSSSPFNSKYTGDLSEFYYFIPIKGKHYIEFINPPDDLDEAKIRGICGKFGHVYDVSINSKLKDPQSDVTSHVAFTTKGPLKKALQTLSGQYEVRRLPKSSPFYNFYNIDKGDDMNNEYDDFIDDE